MAKSSVTSIEFDLVLAKLWLDSSADRAQLEKGLFGLTVSKLKDLCKTLKVKEGQSIWSKRRQGFQLCSEAGIRELPFRWRLKSEQLRKRYPSAASCLSGKWDAFVDSEDESAPFVSALKPCVVDELS